MYTPRSASAEIRGSRSIPGSPTITGPDVHFPPPPRRSSKVLNASEPNLLQTSSPAPATEYDAGNPWTHLRTATRSPFADEKPIAVLLDSDSRPAAVPSTDASEYPDATRANRRKPYVRAGPGVVYTKHDPRLFAVCGNYVCTTGHVTKVLSVHDGELIMTLSHGESVKITSLAFRTPSDPEEEGRWLWLGTNQGDIQEVDIRDQSVVFVKHGAHSRREVVAIHRHGREMWTLDDEGKLIVWPPDESGAPSLAYDHRAFRVPRGHTFSLVVGSELWLATGKEVRVFRPSFNAETVFDVPIRPLCQNGVGEVTSGAIIGSASKKVLFGHTDGKVTIYSPEDYSCLGVLGLSLYKINCLDAVGDLLWAGFNTGMLYIYDTTTHPWMVKKDWAAHDGPVIGVLVDHSSPWKLDGLQTASLGVDNAVRIWDGLLQDDWLESAMHQRDVEYCDFREVSALVVTWNVGASVPESMRHDAGEGDFFRELLPPDDLPDIIVFGFQELVDLENKKITAKSLFRSSKRSHAHDPEHISRQYRAWRDYLSRRLEEHMHGQEPYELLHTASLVGLFTCIFVKASQREGVQSPVGSEIKRGMGGLHGNKGALLVRFTVDDSSLCFVNCHLAAGQTQTTHRNNDVAAILETAAFRPEPDPARQIDLYVGGGDGTMIMDHEICVLHGDLNYRIDTMSRETVLKALEAHNLAKLLERDQLLLLLSRRKNPAFRLRGFQEAAIGFAPTYKYDVGSDAYDTSEKRRAPAWCDRVLSRGWSRVKQLDYRRHEVRISDHRPVSARFRFRVKRISARRRMPAWAQCVQAFQEQKSRLLHQARLDFLVQRCGIDAVDAERLVREREKEAGPVPRPSTSLYSYPRPHTAAE
ncbi:MAG: hypothetical protein M1826_002733 [Phylliscum demangeonii]|nr:MAG: hypothetical protein M1826_002733 [Phylliscum demangeonii]